MQRAQLGAVQAPRFGLRSAATPLDWAKADQRISTYRLVLGWFALITWTVALLGIDWDVQWHVQVGRDGFWTPPHWMFYSATATTGLICLVEILTETFLYYKRYPGVNKKTTTTALFVFRGPVGFMLAGFGMLVMLISAPFDDYYHRIYGIDVKIWSPFHVMLALGMAMASLGLVYLFASEMNRRKNQSGQFDQDGSFLQKLGANLREFIRPATLGLGVAAALLVSRYLLVLAETFYGSGKIGTLTLFGLSLPAYSLVLATLPLLLVALTKFTGRIGTATFVGLLFLLFRFGEDFFTRWGVQTLALDRGISSRGGLDDFIFVTNLYPPFLILAGLAVDLIFLAYRLLSKRPNFRLELGVMALAGLVSGLILYLLDRPWEVLNQIANDYASSLNNRFAASLITQRFVVPDFWQALPLVIIIAALAGLVGRAFATSLRYTDR